jgi:penicillin amidase
VVPPTPGSSALSIKWTGAAPTDELGAFTGYMRARNVEDARVAVRSMGVGAQNFVFADTAGDIFYSTQSLIPKRARAAFTWNAKTFTGSLPCLVLPGDGSAEWTGEYLPEANVPHAKNPARGFLATANGDQVGVTLDNDPSNDRLPNGEPVYLGCFHDPGLRVGRIVKRIESAGHPLTLDDMASIQADARSNMGALLAPTLSGALAHAEAERAGPGAYPDLAAVVATPRYGSAAIADVIDTLARWGSESDYDAAAGVSLEDGSPLTDAREARASTATLVFNTWVVRMFALTLGDELAKMGDPPATESARRILAYLLTADRTKLATYDAATGDSALFDDLSTPAVESRDERAVTALLDALDFLTAKLGADRAAWRWGTLHTLRFESLVSLWGSMSIPPAGDPVFPAGFPRHGDGYNVDVGSYDDRPAKLDDLSFSYREGPVQRLVIDMDPAGPVARNALPGGEVWDPTSKHFRDQAELWRRNQTEPVPFAKGDVVKSAEEHVVLTPGVERPVGTP